MSREKLVEAPRGPAHFMVARLQKLALGLILIALASAALVFTDRTKDRDETTSNAAASKHIPHIAVLTYNRTPNFEESYAGFEKEMAALGYEDGKNCRMTLHDAQFDIGVLNTIVAAISSEKPDVVVPFTTPALQCVVRTIKERPVVFCMGASGIVAGAGTSNSDHLPNVTGAEIVHDWPLMIKVAKSVFPGLRQAGTTYAPSESNSVWYRDTWARALSAAGIELISIGAERPTELPEAADAVLAKGVPVMLQLSDNTASTGFGAIVKSAMRANVPVFTFAPSTMKRGATLAVARDFAEVGEVGARLVDRVLRGEDPAKIPFEATSKTTILVNRELVEYFKLTVPEEFLRVAEFVESEDDIIPGEAPR